MDCGGSHSRRCRNSVVNSAVLWCMRWPWFNPGHLAGLARWLPSYYKLLEV